MKILIIIVIASIIGLGCESNEKVPAKTKKDSNELTINCDKLDLKVTRKGNNIITSIDTDLPKDITLNVSIYKIGYENGQEYRVEGKKNTLAVEYYNMKDEYEINDKMFDDWIKNKNAELEKVGLSYKLDSISNDIIFEVSVAPFRTQVEEKYQKKTSWTGAAVIKTTDWDKGHIVAKQIIK